MDGYVVEVSSRLQAARARFTFAHEIAHTFFMNGESDASKNRTDQETGRFIRKNEEEYLCDVAAAEMLMPEALFMSHVSAYGPSVPAVLALARDFDASLSAVARRFAETSLWKCHIGFWSVALDSTVAFEFGYRPGFMRLSVPKGHVGASDGIVSRATREPKPITGAADVGLISDEGEPFGEAFVQAMYLPALRRVLTMAILERHARYLCRMFDAREVADRGTTLERQLPLRLRRPLSLG